MISWNLYISNSLKQFTKQSSSINQIFIFFSFEVRMKLLILKFGFDNIFSISNSNPWQNSEYLQIWNWWKEKNYSKINIGPTLMSFINIGIRFRSYSRMIKMHYCDRPSLEKCLDFLCCQVSWESYVVC